MTGLNPVNTGAAYGGTNQQERIAVSTGPRMTRESRYSPEFRPYVYGASSGVSRNLMRIEGGRGKTGQIR